MLKLCARLGGGGGLRRSGVRLCSSDGNVVEKDADAHEIYERLPAPDAEVARNKSGLKEKDYRKYHGLPPYKEPRFRTHFTLLYRQKMYGAYGQASGIDPAICWPTPELLQEKLEYERIARPFTIQEMVEAANKRRQERENKIREKEERVLANMAKLEEWKRDLQRRVAKKEADALAIKAKKEKLIEEVRREFGFTLSPKDERFRELLAKKEKAQRKDEKQKKKAARDAEMMKILNEKNATINMDANTKEDP